ncbi:mitochondrial inner membrane protease subunit 1-like [Gigantopelta aegis]|uniref:mitochondrial inner membrane protease subunit 1-like n=1 Tax=Gigantopelta aegis TaxID=1735272 RepID=UPI001B88780E|nr:mitochondrial inner membrane protease subunit 1-like [Gigantopelta aegis]
MTVSMFGRILSKTGGILISILQYGCIAHCSLEFVVDFVSCKGPSMEPTIHSSDIVLTEHISVTRQTIQINLRPVVPRGHVWLEGDNKDNSTDSRTYGPVPYALLRSRVFFKIWPPKDIGTVKFCPDEMN